MNRVGGFVVEEKAKNIYKKCIAKEKEKAYNLVFVNIYIYIYTHTKIRFCRG